MAGMIMCVGAEKGGVGKSTIATNVAVQLATEGVDVVILDTDAQATCARFIERRDSAGIEPRIPCVQRTGDVSATLRDIANRYQVVIVDAGGRDSKELRTALVAAQLLITPTQASQADLETLPKVNELVSLARGLNPDLKAHAVLSRAPSNPMIREVEDAKDLLAEFDELVLADSVIRDRKIYRDALLSGNGVVELANSQAKAEIQLLVQEFFDL
ncbi:ATPase [Burkholderia contaminans]|uniref:division plane positioning ATPase MipZ n=1 Tax=Burkholderia contaminans TaxID=488447 RepID=UPI0014531FF2|nr:division plane positioning ATPase MipZ [Burkholderia contaminans]VWC91976.1 ATPase [Burkholderia contaminans]